jgi:hypothetical protein
MERSTLCITGGVVGSIGIIAIVGVAKLVQNDGPGTGKLIGIGLGVLVGVGAVGGIWMYRGRNDDSLSPERRNAIESEANAFAMNNPALRWIILKAVDEIVWTKENAGEYRRSQNQRPTATA